MFATDRDLLVLEPGVLREVSFLGQRLASGVGSVSGTTLTLAGADFVSQGVTAGHIVLVDGAALEVVQRLSATTLQVSRPRAELADAVIPPAAGTGLACSLTTYRPQIAVVHRQVLAMLGLAAAGMAGVGEVDETCVKNPDALRTLEALGTLHLLFSSASSLAGPDSPLGRRAEEYRRRFVVERGSAVARIDTDGDGVADAARYASTVHLTRG